MSTWRAARFRVSVRKKATTRARELTAAGEKVHSLESIIFLSVRDYRFRGKGGTSDKSRDFQGLRDENDDEARLT